MDHTALEVKLGYCFVDKALLEAALEHPTFVHEFRQKHGDGPSHGKWAANTDGQYAFVGDAVLALALADDPTNFAAGKGAMSTARAAKAKNETLARLAADYLQLDTHLRLGEGERGNIAGEASRLADGLESLIGAVHFDAGPAHAIQIVKALFARDAERKR